MLRTRPYWLMILFLVAFSVGFWPLTIGVISILPLITIVVSLIYLSMDFSHVKKREFLLYGMLFFMVISGLYHFETFRLTTIVYSFGLVISFICYMRLLDQNSVSAEQFLKVIHGLIYAFFVFLVFQQISVLLGVPVLNKQYVFNNAFKLNSLALEPSYLGGTITCLMFAHVKIWRLLHGKIDDNESDFLKNKALWFSYVYMSISNGSSWTIVAFLLFALYLFKKNKIAIVIGTLLIPISLTSLMSFEAFSRIYNVIPVILEGDVEKIRHLDPSASARIAPLLFYIEDLNIFSSNFWLGFGIDYSKSNMIYRLWGKYNAIFDADASALGGVPAFFYDYGFFAGLFLLLSLRKFAFKEWLSFPAMLYVFCFFPIGLNTYMTWGFFTIMYSIIYYEKSIKQK